MQGAVSDSTVVDLWIVNADGSGHSQLTADHGSYTSYAWGLTNR